MKIKEYKGINYTKPTVVILADNGIAHSEFAGRTCYDSFENSEHDCIKEMNELIQKDELTPYEDGQLDQLIKSDTQNVNDSTLLKQLSFVHFHHSVLEHSIITFFIKGISRAVLQELVRHRIASYSVKSTRYTLDQIMYNFIVAKYIYTDSDRKEFFIKKTLEISNLFTIADNELNTIELDSIYNKLEYHTNKLGKKNTLNQIIPKSNIQRFIDANNIEEAFELLTEKKKRNVGDAFKSIVVSESMSVDLTMTINLRSLKNFFDLRLSGAAWFQIQWLAQEMKKVLPEKYSKMIFKETKVVN